MKLDTLTRTLLFCFSECVTLEEWVIEHESIKDDYSYKRCRCHLQTVCFNCAYHISMKAVLKKIKEYESTGVPRDVTMVCLYMSGINYEEWQLLGPLNRQAYREKFQNIVDSIEKVSSEWEFPLYTENF